MARVRSPNRDKAFEIYKEHAGNIELVEIAQILNVSSGTVRGWKKKDLWDEKLKETFQINTERSKRKKGAQPRNKNSEGAPKGNKRAEKHGFFSKYLPEDTFNIIQDIEIKNPLDILWENIQIQYAAIIRAQKIMYVKSIEDKTVEKIEERNGDSSYGEKWEVQQAWDKQANFLNAQSRAMKTLEGMIKQYDELLNKNWSLVTEEQKTRIKVLKAKVNNDNDSIIKDDGFIEALEGKVEEIWED